MAFNELCRKSTVETSVGQQIEHIIVVCACESAEVVEREPMKRRLPPSSYITVACIE